MLTALVNRLTCQLFKNYISTAAVGLLNIFDRWQ